METRKKDQLQTHIKDLEDKNKELQKEDRNLKGHLKTFAVAFSKFDP